MRLACPHDGLPARAPVVARTLSGRGPCAGASRLTASRSGIVQGDARAMNRQFAAQRERIAMPTAHAVPKADSPVNQKHSAAAPAAPAA